MLKLEQYKRKTPGFRKCFAFDPTFEFFSVHAQPCHLLKAKLKNSASPSTSTPTNINTQFSLQSLCLCVCVQIRVMYV